jgi:small-conductance mechanosensitive channel
MELFTSLYSLLQKWFNEFTTIQGGLQMGSVVGCFVLAWLTHKRWQQFITRLLGNLERKAIFSFLLDATNRISFPMSMLLYLVIARFIIGRFGVNTAVLDVFTPLMLSLAGIQLTVFVLRSSFTPSPALHAWEGVISLGMWSVVALHLTGWLPDVLATLDGIAIGTDESRFSLLSLIKLMIALVLFVVAAGWLLRLIEARARRAPYLSPSMRVGMIKVSKFGLYALAFLLALKSVGIDMTTFAVFSGAIGVGIGFGLQKIFSNFISGFILLFDRSIRPGDVISIGTRFGWVQALQARYVVVRDRDGVETLIPNENLITSEVTNWSYTDRNVRQSFPVQISYNDDPEFVMNMITEIATMHPRVLLDPAPVTRLIRFGDNGIDLELRVWISDPEAGIGNIRSDIYLKIWKSFKEHGITIPFPQRDIHQIAPAGTSP